MRKVKLSNHTCTKGLCKIKHQDSSIVLEENNKTYRMNNSIGKTISYYDLDDCVFSNRATHNSFNLCDKVIIIHEKDAKHNKQEKDYIWLELKGSDLNEACKQILNSYKNAIDYDTHVNHFARVVLKRVKGKDESKSNVKRLKRIFKNQFDYSSNPYNKDKSSNLFIKKF